LHKKDIALLELIQSSLLGVGNITKQNKYEMVDFRVTSLKDLINVIIPHFDKYPLITQKKADFELFKRVINLMNRREHLNADGLQEIVNIRASINLGLSDVLKEAFPDVIPVERPLVTNKKIKDSNWLAGFISGEGCFFIGITKSKTNVIGFSVSPRLSITQHSRDKQLMQSLIDYLGCGKYYSCGNKYKGEFIVRNLSDITSIIIPLFKKYPIEGIKALNFEYFCRAVLIIQEGRHLSKDGLEEIRQIKSGMNKNRYLSNEIYKS
jgi:hypothetical protein